MPTPLMEQYLSLKARHPGELLLFRCGDFYELFYEDARIASETLGIALTTRSKEEGIPMAGVPFHSVEGYIRRLLAAGKRVALAEQLGDPGDSPGLIERDVTEVVSPGTVTEWSMLEERAASHLLAIAPARGSKERVGLAWLDISTGRFLAEDIPRAALEEELARIDPRETLVPDGAEGDALAKGALRARVATPYPAFAFEEADGRASLERHFGVRTLEGFGLDGVAPALGAAGALLRYVGENKKDHLRSIARIERFSREGTLVLDPATRRALELVETARTRERKGSLLAAIDRTRTAMGARLLREWLEAPLRDLARIGARQDAVASLLAAPPLLERAEAALEGIQDVERLCSRIAARRATPRDLAALERSLAKAPPLKEALGSAEAALLRALALEVDPQEPLCARIAATLVDAPPLSAKEGGVIRPGVDPELDRLRALSHEGKAFLAELQRREVERTGIPSLKIGHNSVFGYYIEITNAHQAKVPKDYQRKQTLKNAERYVTDELKEHERQVVSARERADALEERIFLSLREEAAALADGLRASARAIAQADALASLARLARERRYVRPALVDAPRLLLREARHPVLEQTLEGEPFVPNDLALDEERRIAVVTGPNMAGKSTFCRQTALILLLAQMGGFVPAAEAEIGLADRIFARIGAADEIARGLSTFMVEMTETANILHNATERSLVILDEVGRGTSTFDGVSLAFAITEHLSEKVRARTLFATHYHELCELAEVDPRVRNLNVAVKEWGEEIVFLRKIVEGAADRSYGLHVARLAGVPRRVIERAKEVLESLERLQIDGAGRPRLARREAPAERRKPRQLALFASEEERCKAALLALDIPNMRPVDALAFLADWQERLRGV
jgi:DNA mismatch repair protein MutS